jgi:hypothetical protein
MWRRRRRFDDGSGDVEAEAAPGAARGVELDDVPVGEQGEDALADVGRQRGEAGGGAAALAPVPLLAAAPAAAPPSCLAPSFFLRWSARRGMGGNGV